MGLMVVLRRGSKGVSIRVQLEKRVPEDEERNRGQRGCGGSPLVVASEVGYGLMGGRLQGRMRGLRLDSESTDDGGEMRQRTWL